MKPSTIALSYLKETWGFEEVEHINPLTIYTIMQGLEAGPTDNLLSYDKQIIDYYFEIYGINPLIPASVFNEFFCRVEREASKEPDLIKAILIVRRTTGLGLVEANKLLRTIARV